LGMSAFKILIANSLYLVFIKVFWRFESFYQIVENGFGHVRILCFFLLRRPIFLRCTRSILFITLLLLLFWAKIEHSLGKIGINTHPGASSTIQGALRLQLDESLNQVEDEINAEVLLRPGIALVIEDAHIEHILIFILYGFGALFH